ncbi:MAG: hypothetical protein WD249_02160 [Gaiellaceae bacterium]
MTLEIVTAVAGAVFLFCLVLLIFGDGRGGLPVPRNPIGFSPPT